MSAIMSQSLLSTRRGLICLGAGQPLVVQLISMPEAVPGSVIVSVLAAPIDHVMPHELAGEMGWMTLPTPFIPGPNAIGRVAAIGSDSTSFQLGQLVMLEPFVRGRGYPEVQILWGLTHLGSPRSKNLINDLWRNGTYAEYTRVPLENCYPLNEKILLGNPAQGGLVFCG
jgi:NADPH:quinone reductase-like Zn-dependent oxidoreductase